MTTNHKTGLQHKNSESISADTAVWVFDLDNTLYPHGTDLFAQMDVKMGGFIADMFSVDRIEARRIQKDYLMRYGTTLRGLMNHHGVDPHHYLQTVHDLDLSAIKRDPALREALQQLPGRKLVFTNADTPYAERVLDKLGVADILDTVFDIHAADFAPKPDQTAYDMFMKKHGVDPTQAVMVEDMARNLKPAKEMGMQTVWVNTGSVWGEADHHPDFIDVEISDLSAWLTKLTNQ